VTGDDAMSLVGSPTIVRVRSAANHAVMAEGTVVAYSQSPQILVIAADGSRSWWPINLPIDVLEETR
jgi:hypothetical protein